MGDGLSAAGAAGCGDSPVPCDLDANEVVRNALAEARLIDDGFMVAALKDRADCLEVIARAALGDPTLRLSSLRSQEVLPGMPGMHGARLDFLCERDGGGRVVVEVQSAARGFDPRRARFYASLLDAWSLPAGTPYRDLPDCALIAMCEDDPVGRGLPLYTFSRTAAEDGGLFGERGDGSAIVIVSCEDPDEGTEIGRVAHDMLCADPRDMLVGPLADAARAAKERDVGPMSKWNDMVEGIRAAGRAEGMAEGKAEGMAEGKAEGRLAAYADLVRDGLLAQSAAAERLGMTQEQFAEEAAKLAPTGA
ncbi:MAG TPA: hypothetical protein DCP91_09730 [Eggerthellaceae bacterium]|nr:hypothetical protein [Eggerthellaceae bacterium]